MLCLYVCMSVCLYVCMSVCMCVTKNTARKYRDDERNFLIRIAPLCSQLNKYFVNFRIFYEKHEILIFDFLSQLKNLRISEARTENYDKTQLEFASVYTAFIILLPFKKQNYPSSRFYLIRLEIALLLLSL